ncbi:hypothetical protein Hanom_Chr05g00401461 [Helianthus anomalus]
MKGYYCQKLNLNYKFSKNKSQTPQNSTPWSIRRNTGAIPMLQTLENSQKTLNWRCKSGPKRNPSLES